MVVAVPSGDAGSTCGGEPMIDASSGESAGGDIHPDHAVGIAMGKRYINEAETLKFSA